MQPTLTRESLVAAGALAAVPEAIQRHQLGTRWLLICDDNTWTAAGEALTQCLEAARHQVTPFPLGNPVAPSLTHGRDIALAADGYDGLIAIGSGTINDLTKYAANLVHKPYIAVATAASMNGYVSASASLLSGEVKQSHFAQPPHVLIADLDVLAQSPKRMTRAGMGDTLCRSSVEADMLLSHHLLDTDYPRPLFDLLRVHEPGVLIHASALRDHQPAALAVLMEALIAGGNAMATYGSSAPASQGEHMIAATAEMLYPSETRGLLHGELIAVTSLTMIELQREMLEITPFVKPLPREDTLFQRLFGKDAGPQISAIYQQKHLSEQQAYLINKKIESDWREIRGAIEAILAPPETLLRSFVQAMLPSTPRDLKIKREHYKMACRHAHLTRERFGFLDLAAMMGQEVWEG